MEINGFTREARVLGSVGLGTQEVLEGGRKGARKISETWPKVMMRRGRP